MVDFLSHFLDAFIKLDFQDPISVVLVETSLILLVLMVSAKYVLVPWRNATLDLKNVQEELQKTAIDMHNELSAIRAELRLVRDDLEHAISTESKGVIDNSKGQHGVLSAQVGQVDQKIIKNTETVIREIEDAVSRLSAASELTRTSMERSADKSESLNRSVSEHLTAIKSEVRHLSSLIQTVVYTNQRLK